MKFCGEVGHGQRNIIVDSEVELDHSFKVVNFLQLYF